MKAAMKPDMPVRDERLSLFDLKGPAPDLKVGDMVTTVITGKVTSVRSSALDDTPEANDAGKQNKGVTHDVTMTRLSCKFIKGTKSNAELSAMDMNQYAKARMKK